MGRTKYIELSLTVVIALLVQSPAMALSYDEIILMVQAEKKVFGQANNSQSFDDRLKALELSALGSAGSGSDSQRLKAVCRKLGLLSPEPVTEQNPGKESKLTREESRALKHEKKTAAQEDRSITGAGRSLSPGGKSVAHEAKTPVHEARIKAHEGQSHHEDRTNTPEDSALVHKDGAAARENQSHNRLSQEAKSTGLTGPDLTEGSKPGSEKAEQDVGHRPQPPVNSPVVASVAPESPSATQKAPPPPLLPASQPAGGSPILGLLLIVAGTVLAGLTGFVFMKAKGGAADSESESEPDLEPGQEEYEDSPYPHRTRREGTYRKSSDSFPRQENDSPAFERGLGGPEKTPHEMRPEIDSTVRVVEIQPGQQPVESRNLSSSLGQKSAKNPTSNLSLLRSYVNTGTVRAKPEPGEAQITPAQNSEPNSEP